MAVELKKLIVAQADSNLSFALSNLERYIRVGGEETLSARQKEEREHFVEVNRLKLDEAKRELDRFRLENEIAIERAASEVEIAREKLGRSILHAPRDGTILEIKQREGETTGDGPFITMADLSTMYVLGEVFEGDILKVSPGLRATVTSNALPTPLRGHVESVGRFVSEQTKVAQVRIILEISDVAAKLINLEVNISIHL